MNKPLIVLGGGGHASVLVDLLATQGREIIALVCPGDIAERAVFNDIRHLRKDDDVLRFSPDSILLVNGIGFMPNSSLRHSLYEKFSKLGYQFESVISQNAIVSPKAKIPQGVQIFHNAVIQTGASIGENTIINTGAIIEHDCQIGKNNHIASGAILCGQVHTKENVFVGAHATIIQNITIEHSSVIGAGSVITSDIACEHISYSSRPIIRERF